MTLIEKINLLKDVVKHLKELNNDQFIYVTYVRKFDKENYCGTKCCVAGYYPQWFPEANLIYTKSPYTFSFTIVPKYSLQEDDVRKTLCDFHELSDRLIGILFYGENFLHERFDGSKICIYSDNCATLEEVIERFEVVIEGLTDGNITPDLAHKSRV